MGGRASKAKGSLFERAVCVKLSLWVTDGASKDCFWRSAMSGGRASRGLQRGDILRRQAGDITAVAPEGHALTDRFYIELKHLKDIELMSFILSNAGRMWHDWAKAREQAERYGRRPMMIAKQNHYDTLVLTEPKAASRRVPLAVARGVYMYSLEALLQQRFTTCL